MVTILLELLNLLLVDMLFVGALLLLLIPLLRRVPDPQLQQARHWLRSKGNSIEGGTSEIQLNIVAKHILGLPG